MASNDTAIDLSPASSMIGLSLNDYYQWVNNSSFYAMADAYIYPFYQNWIRLYDYWINGLVPYFHDISQGLVPTHLSRTIVNKMASLILGGGVLFQNANKEANKGEINEALDFISNKWSKKVGLIDILKQAIEQTAGLGNCALKLNMDDNNELWVDIVPMNRGFFDLDARGKITKAKCWVNIYTRTVSANNEVSYGLVEERYYNEEHKSVVKYNVYQMPAKVNNFAPAPQIIMGWDSLPSWLREQIKSDYGNIRIGEEMTLPFSELGMFLMKWTPCIQSMPQVKFGDSCLANVMTYLCQYDYLNAIMVTEMYSGRARVLLPKQFNTNAKNKVGTQGNFNAGLDSFIYTLYDTLTTDNQKPEFVQPEMRAEAMLRFRNMILENIATALRLSPSTFASYLQDSSNRTAREVSAEESSTTLEIDDKRMLILCPINEMIKVVLEFYGFTDDVVARFSKAGQTNYSLLVENTIKLVQAGLMSRKQAIAMLNPEKDQYQLEEEEQQIELEEKERQEQQANSMFGMEYGSTQIGGDGQEV